MTTEQAINILRTITAYGNPVAATWLHLLENETSPDRAARIVAQVATFASCWEYEQARVRNRINCGPSEYKGETMTPALGFVE